jgi:ubiquinone/menaquinone biosynthesis C-methylase UbiE
VSCANYVEPRLAAVYDHLNPPGKEDAFYADLAGTPPKTILDMGCGTGRFVCKLAMLGHHVTGADPAAAMLEIARGREGGHQVTWVASDAAGLDLATRFDLIIMTGHAFQTLLGDTEIGAALRAFARHLAPRGKLAFETRNPQRREWETWIPDLSRETVRLPDGSSVEVHNDIRPIAGELITYETHFRFGPDDTAVGVDTLRFMDQARLTRHLMDAGLTSLTWYGEWDGSAVSSSSPELIVVCQP